jgi:VanZ family protein
MVSAAIVLISPFMGQLQSFLRRSLSTRAYVLLFGVCVLGAVLAAIVFALLRIRERPASAFGFGGPSRAARFGWLIAALTLGGGYMWLNATPYPEVNAVERVHFVEYGLIAFLFYRVWKDAGDVSSLILPLLAAFVVGTFDEWLQWFIPVRVGEAHDVFLNLTSIVCGLLFGVALQPPDAFSWRPRSGTLRRVGLAAGMVWLVFATFVSQVHLGYENAVEGIGRFRSHYSTDRLGELQQDRLARWSADPPRVLRRLSQEDQYLDEGLWHIRQRNRAEQPAEAWRENLILERYFAPVLDIPTYATPEATRWPSEQRVNMEAAGGIAATPFVSAAEPYPIVAWRKDLYWSVVTGVALACFAMAALSLKRP